MTMIEQSPGSPNQSNYLPEYAKDTDRPYVGDPWDRQPKETALAYERFCSYRDMDPDERSVAEAARRDGKKNPHTFYIMSSKHRWEERAAAYDAYMAAKLRARLERKKLKAAEKHADQMEDALEVLSLPSSLLAQRLREQAANNQLNFIEELTDSELLKLAKAFSGDLPGLQKAQRDALSSASDTPALPTAQIKAKGQLLRQIVGNKDVLAMVERITLEVSEEQATGTDDEAK